MDWPYDIALLHLSTPLQFNYNICPIEFANSCNISSNDIQIGTPISISGWGEASINSPTTNYNDLLQQAIMSIYDNALTVQAFQNAGYSLPPLTNLLSVYVPNSQPNITASYGDKGAPAIVNNSKGNKILFGQVTAGSPYPSIDNLPTILQNIQFTSNWVSFYTKLYPDQFASLYMQDKPWDIGVQPSLVNEVWSSDDIWIRNQDDGLINQEHQNPEYYAQPNNYNYVYVKVRNRGCQANTGKELLKLYWAKAATALSWPGNWDGSLSVNGQSLGNIIGTATIPVIQPGHAEIIKFAWQPPNPQNYVGLATGNPIFTADEPHHFCILARIESTADPMVITETQDIVSNAKNNNNIIWKNLSVIDLDPNNLTNQTEGIHLGASVLTGDAWGKGGRYDIELKNSKDYNERSLNEEAEIKVTLDNDTWEKWANGGYESENIKIADKERKQLIIKGDPARLNNLLYKENERSLLNVRFNFLTEKLSPQTAYHYDVIQKDKETNEIVGGEEYFVRVPHKKTFNAEAGQNQEINPKEIVYLHAEQITEAAIYNWYDMNDSLIFTGKDLNISPDVTKKYKLEVISGIDGFKDYDTVEVKVKDLIITKIFPNPTTSLVNIEYKTINASTGYLMIIKHDGTFSNQYVINVLQNVKQINTSAFPPGLYSTILICDGKITDYKNLYIQ